jgi:hypothetical protein
MGFKEDLIKELRANTRPDVDEMSDVHLELARLRRHVRVLERLLVELATYKVDGGGGTPTSIGKHLLYVVGEAADEAREAEEETDT